MRHYRFPCDCTWPILRDATSPDVLPLLDFRIESAPESCPATWALLGRGDTKGVFQLESNLGKHWTKQQRPESAEHLSALGALLRPGCLRAVDSEGVSMTQHYCRRKNNEEEIRGYHPAIDAILFPTYNVMVYQEQAMAIAQAVAGFNLQEADQLRKAIGKKLPEEMAKCKKLFMEGAARVGLLTAEQAAEVFGWIQESQRYSFNHSHAMCYGLTGYECAYIKAHFPLAFFVSWLDQAKNKQDPRQEIFELVNDAKLFDIVVEPPDIRSLEAGFHSDGVVVKFGLGEIKGVGAAQMDKLRAAFAAAGEVLGKPLGEWSWPEFLIFCSGKLTSSVVTRLVQVGAFRYMGVGRQVALAEHEAWASLTDKEQEWVQGRRFTGLVEAMKALSRPRLPKKPPKVKVRVSRKGKEDLVAVLQAEHRRLCVRFDREVTQVFEGGGTLDETLADHQLGLERLIWENRTHYEKATKIISREAEVPTTESGGCSSPAREHAVKSQIAMLESPPTSLEDSPHRIAYFEEDLLGIAISCSKLDSCDLDQVNVTCKDYLAGQTGFLMFGVEIQQVREVRTKRGKTPGAKMAFLTVADQSCSLQDVVVFPDVWKDYGHLLNEGGMVVIQGQRDDRDAKSTSLVVKKVWQASMAAGRTAA